MWMCDVYERRRKFLWGEVWGGFDTNLNVDSSSESLTLRPSIC